jgi:MATE family multidrug resistance protein
MALPLVLSTCSLTLQVFIDRVFLAWHSEAAIAAAIPTVCVLWLVQGPLWGIVGFANTFVAQYHGAGRHRRIGPAVGQSLLVAVAGGTAVLVLLPFSRTIFTLIGHDAEVAELEAVYFDTLVFSTMPMLVMTAASCFFGGMGRTWVVCAINVVASIVNIVLDYAMIFGHWGFPEWGIAGAGWATAIAYVIGAAVAIALVYFADDEGRYGVWIAQHVARPESAKGVADKADRNGSNSTTPFADSGRATHRSWMRVDADLIRRLIRFGGPSGLLFLIEVAAWTWFELLVGRIGTAELAATNVAFNINMIAFLPMFGLCMAAQILTGQRLGENRPDLAERSVWSAFSLAFAYTAAIGLGFLLVPNLFIAPFRWGAGGSAAAMTASGATADWAGTVVTLLRFVAVYMLFDMALNIFAGALRGAGDTRFVMGAMLAVAVGVLGVPSYLAIAWWGAGIYSAWCLVTAYVIALGAVFFWRFQSGVWRSMRVIESSVVDTEPATPEPAGCAVG